MMKPGLYVIFLVLLSSLVSAATIHGNVYSFDLELRNDSIVSVDTSPKQAIVAKDGVYSLELDPGKYTITASYYVDGKVEEKSTEKVEIKKEGSFVLDLIMFPSFEEEEFLLEEAGETIIEDEGLRTFDIVLVIVFLVALGASVFYIMKAQKKIKKMERPKVSDLADKVIAYIEKQDGRVTQKEIRKQFPLSEAKISLVISELEHKNVVKRIKKGRGNIIVLN